MRRLRAWRRRMLGLVRNSAREQELADEIESHIQMQAEENERAGMSPVEARRHAILKLGGAERTRQAYRERDTLPWLENLLHDLRFALRQLMKNPGFAVTAVLTLALGIGALTTVFTWTNAVLYSPWPHVDAPRRLRFIDATVLGNEGYSVHYDVFRFLRSAGRSWRDAIAFAQTSVNLTERGVEARALTAGTVSSNYFHFLGMRPQVGRFFQADADDHAFGAHDEIVLSDALWRDRFHADPAIVGRALSINRHPFTVVGVAPREFAGIFGGVAEDAWIPLSGLRDLSADAPPDPLQHHGLQVAVRLRTGAGDTAAAAEVHALARSFAQQHADPNLSRWDLNLRDAAHFERGLAGFVGRQLPILFGASLLLMVLVCINIASLLGQHAARRRREIAIRSALGAGPRRIAAQMLAETGVLAAAGALAGWVASMGMTRGLYVLLPHFGANLAFNLRGDTRILLFVTVVAVAVTLLCGFYPVRQSLRVSQNEALHEGGAAVAGGSRNRFGRRIVLGLQLGICFVVLVCSALLVRTAFNIVNHATDFDPNDILTAGVDLGRGGYTEQRGLAFQAALLDRLRNLPGVASATLTSHLPMGDDGSGNTRGIGIPGYVPAKGEEMEVITDAEGPDFFRTMHIKLRHGREFAAGDNAAAAPVVMVNATMAQRYWPKGNALGSSIVVDGHPHRVIGIVADDNYYDPTNVAPTSVLFVPMAQSYSSDAILALRARGMPAVLASELRRSVASLDVSLPLEDVRTMKAVMGERYQMSSIPAKLLTVYALSSLLVAMLGLYAVMAYSVIERHREFALRMALGSTRAAVFRLVLGGSAWITTIGLVVGGAGSFAAVRVLRSLLFGVTPFDPLSYCAATLCLLLTVFLAGAAPARRAAAIEPMQALRAE